MRTPQPIAFAAFLLLAPATGVGQETRGSEEFHALRRPVIGVPAEAIGIENGVEPLNGSVEWLREEVDPIRRARRQIRKEMYRRADEQALEAAAGAVRSSAPRDPAIEWADWRFSIGNNGNWSPYPDRELDARVIRFPLRMKTDNRPEAEKALDRMRKTGSGGGK